MTDFEVVPPGLPDEVGEIIASASAIEDTVRRIGQAITEDYCEAPPTLVTVLRGGLFFLADLCRRVDLPVRLDFMAVSAYTAGKGGVVRITKDLDDPIEGVPVIVVEDIVDTGLTLNYLLGVLRSREPASLEVCALLDKDVRRIVDLPIRYRGFRIPDKFVVGYGLDLRGTLRNLPYVATLRESALAP